MNHGQLIQVATPPEIYEFPNSRWVADFIGDVNLIEGRVIEAGEGGTVIASPTAGRLRGLACRPECSSRPASVCRCRD